MGREEALAALAAEPEQLEGVAAVQCRGNFMFDPATHRDFLGKRSRQAAGQAAGQQWLPNLCRAAMARPHAAAAAALRLHAHRDIKLPPSQPFNWPLPIRPHAHPHAQTPSLHRPSPLCPAPPPAPPPPAGACLGTGIDRDKVGDILITGEQGAQILVAPNLVEHLMVALTQVGVGGGVWACLSSQPGGCC